MLKVGLPGAKEGLQARDVTIAELLKAQGYVTGQFGRTTSATVTNICPPRTASASSMVRFTTSTPRKSRRIPTTSRTRR